MRYVLTLLLTVCLAMPAFAFNKVLQFPNGKVDIFALQDGTVLVLLEGALQNETLCGQLNGEGDQAIVLPGVQQAGFLAEIMDYDRDRGDQLTISVGACYVYQPDTSLPIVDNAVNIRGGDAGITF